MGDFDKINILGTVVNVKDSTARNLINTTNNNLDELSKKVTKLHHKSYIFIGDSYTQGYSPDGNISNTFVNQIISNLQIVDFKIYANGGASFANSNNNFLTLLKNSQYC